MQFGVVIKGRYSSMAIENEKLQTLELPPGSSPRRYGCCHLKSRTYQTLVRILSIFPDDSFHHQPLLSEAAQEHPNLDNGEKESGQGIEAVMRDQSLGINTTETENFEDIEIDEDFEAICLQDTGYREALSALEFELEGSMGINGNASVVPVGAIPPAPFPNNMGIGGGDQQIENQENRSGLQDSVPVEDGSVRPLQSEIKNQSCKDSEAVASSSCKYLVIEVPKLGETGQGEVSLLESNATTEPESDGKLKAVEIEKSVLSPDKPGLSPCVISKGDNEEGEISGDDVVIKSSGEDVVDMQEKAKGDQIANGIGLMNKEDFASKRKREDGKHNEPPSSWKGIGVPDNGGDPKLCIRPMVKYDTFLDEEPPNQGSGEGDLGVGNKKKRGNGSSERKKKNKRKKRSKEAEKSGVKRPKLFPVTTPKPVSECRHFLKGRCHKGDDCNFSHDAVPLTKSQPCRYFAHKACMKGEDCPYDHQLSKYPCTNYVTNGDCSRGGSCLFSHKVPTAVQPKDSPSAPGVSTHDVKSLTSQTILKSKQQLNDNGGAQLTASVAPKPNVNASAASKNAKQSSGNLLKPPAKAPHGISFLSFGKTSVGDSSKLKQSALSSKKGDVATGNGMIVGVSQDMNKTLSRTSLPMAPSGINFLSYKKDSLVSMILNRESKIEKSPAQDSDSRKAGCSSLREGNGGKVCTQMSASPLMQNLCETPQRTPSLGTVRGMNFLSGGKAPMAETSTQKRATLLSQKESSKASNIDIAPVDNSGTHYPPFSPLKEAGDQVVRSALPVVRNVNEASKKETPLVPLSGGNCLSDKKTPMPEGQCSSSSRKELGVSTPEGKFLSDKLQKSTSAMPWGVASSPLVPAQSLDGSPSGHDKNKSSQVPKSLLSTLSFAEKVEPVIRSIEKASKPASEINRIPNDGSTSKSSRFEPVKASAILDFLDCLKK